MANKRISQLPFVGNTGYTATDIMPIVNYLDVSSGTTKHTPLVDLQAYIISGITDDIITGGTYSGGTLVLNSPNGPISISGFTTGTTLYEVGTGLDSTQRVGVSADASGDYSIVAGGNSNSAYGCFSTVSGGFKNFIEQGCSVIGGGLNNTISGNTYDKSIIGGGYCNYICGPSNFIGGGELNKTIGFLHTVSGGYANTNSNYFGSTIGGGVSNTNLGNYSTIGGGSGNTAFEKISFIGGGESNIIDFKTTLSNCTIYGSTIGGGSYNTITTNLAPYSLEGYGDVIGGGTFNTIVPLCFNGNTIVGGWKNTTLNLASTIVGGFCNIAERLVFIGGGSGNTTLCSPSGSVIVGGSQNRISVVNPAQCSSIVGGTFNQIESNESFIGGGRNNTVLGCGGAFGEGSVIVGGCNNTSIDKAFNFIGNGCCNTVSGFYSFIGNGSGNTINVDCSFIGSGFRNVVEGNDSIIGVGYENYIGRGYSTISGGYCNTTDCNPGDVIGGGYLNKTFSCYYGKNVIGGGCDNTISSCYGLATISGGWGNTTSATYSVIAGGQYNTISSEYTSNIGGGFVNQILSDYSTIGGGYVNVISQNGVLSVTQISSPVWGISSTYIVYKFFVNSNGNGNGVSFIIQTDGSGNISNIVVNDVGGGYQVGEELTILGLYFGFPGQDLILTVASTSGTKFSSFIGGGGCNITNSDYSVISGGYCNLSLGDYSFIGGGANNTANNCYSVINGGSGNTANCLFSVIVGGQQNTTIGGYPFIGSGSGNTITSDYSGILGGLGNIVTGNTSFAISCQAQVYGDRSVVIGGSGITATENDMVYMPSANIQSTGYLYFGDPNLDGSWRIYKNGATLDVEKRVLGVWTYSGQFT